MNVAVSPYNDFMEDELLKRNRRNFVALSSAIFIVNLFGWQFPDSITLLGNEFKSSGSSVHIMAAILFVYWGWEYWISFSQKVDWWRTEWRKVLLYRFRLRKDILDQVDKNSIATQVKQNKDLVLDHAKLNWSYVSSDGMLMMSGDGVLAMSNQELPSYTNISTSFSIEYKKIRWNRFLATVKFMMTNPVAFNLWVPWLIAGSALLTELLRLSSAYTGS